MKLTQYLRDTKAEFAHVSWLSRRQTLMYTVLIIIVTLAVAAILGLFDTIFAALLRLVIAV